MDSFFSASPSEFTPPFGPGNEAKRLLILPKISIASANAQFSIHKEEYLSCKTSYSALSTYECSNIISSSERGFSARVNLWVFGLKA